MNCSLRANLVGEQVELFEFGVLLHSRFKHFEQLLGKVAAVDGKGLKFSFVSEGLEQLLACFGIQSQVIVREEEVSQARVACKTFSKEEHC